MGAWIPAVASALGNVASSAIGAVGQANLNIANRDFAANQAQLNRAFQAQQTQGVENWETTMSNTAMQRRVADLKAAGLNPWTALGTAGPATQPSVSAPSGSMANTPSTANPFANIGNPVAAALQGAQSAADIAQKQAQTDNITADTNLKNAGLPYAAQTAWQNLNNLKEMQNQIRSQWHTLDSQWDLNITNTAGLMQNQAFQRELFPLAKQTQELDIQRQRLGMPALQADANFWSGLPSAARNIILGLREAGGGFQAATGGVNNAASLLKMIPLE